MISYDEFLTQLYLNTGVAYTDVPRDPREYHPEKDSPFNVINKITLHSENEQPFWRQYR